MNQQQAQVIIAASALPIANPPAAAILPAPDWFNRGEMIQSPTKNARFSAAIGFYLIAVLGTIGGALLTTGVFFFTHQRFGWGLKENFRLAVLQGIVYTTGALLAAKLVARVRANRALVLVHASMSLAAGTGAVIVSSPLASRGGLVVLGPLLVYTFLSAVAWPILEGLVSTGGLDAHALSRRLTVYNLVWSGTMAAVLALSGTLIQSGPGTVLAVPAISHALAAAWALVRHRLAGGESSAENAVPAVAPDPEPELLRLRTVALWVSRLVLPATYGVIFGLMPMMPSLPVMQSLGPRAQTVAGSTWPAARWGAFAALAMGTWWHRRPRLLLAAAWLMLLAFLAMTIQPTRVWGLASSTYDLGWLIVWQALLGIALGVIYSGSLYFGMVLSDGSTEHGGYHEALIGLGWMLGPAAGTAAGWVRPGNISAGVVAIGTLIAVSVLATTGAAFVAGRRGSAH